MSGRLASEIALWYRSLRRTKRQRHIQATDPGDHEHIEALRLWQAHFTARKLNVVGNAQSLFFAEHGELIDQAETIRFNSAQIVDDKCQGTRWDMLASSNPDTIELYREIKPKFSTLLFTPYCDEQLALLERVPNNVQYLVYPMRMSIELARMFRAPPTTGAQILHLLHVLDVKNVGVFGFDWRATKTFYSDRRRDPHNHYAEYKYFKNIIRKQGWSLHVNEP